MKQGKVLLFLMCWVGLFLPYSFLAAAAPTDSVGATDPTASMLEIKPGFNLFKTVENGETFIDLSSVGGPTKVPLQGNAKPLAKLNNELLNRVRDVDQASLAAIDTVVEIKEKKGIDLSKESEIAAELEMLALSLKSIKPIDIGFLKKFPAGTLADLYVTVGIVDSNSDSAKKLSTGKMIARHEKDNGGSFDFKLEVYPELTLVKPGGDFNNPQDWLLTTPYTGEPINIGGDGTWRSERGIFVIGTISTKHDGLQEVHKAEQVASVTRESINLSREDILSLVALPSSSLPTVGTQTVMDAQINTKVAMLTNPNLPSFLLATFAKNHIVCNIAFSAKTLEGLEQRDLEITSLQQEFLLPAEAVKAGLGNAIKISINPKKTNTGTIISDRANIAYPAIQTVNLFVIAEANGMTLVNREPIVFVGKINQWPPNNAMYYQQKSVDFYMADGQFEPQGEAIMQFVGSEVQLFSTSSQPSSGTLQFSQPEYSANENQGRVTVWVERHGGSKGDIAVKYGTTSLTAQAGVDYQPLSGELMWTDGEMTSKPIDVAIVNDNERESDETFYVTLLDSLGNPGSPKPLFNKPLHVPVTIEDDDFIKITLPPIFKPLPLFTPINVTIINPMQLPARLFSFSLRKTKDHDDTTPLLFDDQSLDFISSLPDTLAELNLPELTIETNGQMNRLELPIFSANDSQLPQAWYSVWVGNPVELASQDVSVTGILTHPTEEIAYWVFEGHEGKYYQSPLYPALHPQILAALAEAFPQATLTLAAEGNLTFTQGNETFQVKVSYVVTPSGLDTEPLTIKPLEGNFLELSAHGRSQQVQLVRE